MRVPLSWLSTFISVPSPLDGLLETCDLAGLEVAGVSVLGEGWSHMVTARIVSVEPIAGAHVQRVRVDIGSGSERTSACGAPNVDADSVGRLVVAALPGARVRMAAPTGEVIDVEVGKRDVLGFTSEAVLCSEREIGLSEDHSGLLFLSDDTPVGAPLATVLGDRVIDFELTPDLGRCLSIFGTAREVAALTRTPLRRDGLVRADVGEPGGSVPVTISAPELSNRYLGAVLRGVTVGSSPAWMQKRLLATGMRPINVIVDIANYVMLEMGQPLHFFDLAKLAGPRIDVRTARPGEKLLALNGLQYELHEDALLIVDGAGPVAVAGVIGGMESAVSATTTDVLLEAAHFDYRSVRHTTQVLKLRTDAAERFIKDIDPEWTKEAMRRAIALVLELCPGATLEGYQDVYPVKPTPAEIPISEREVERILGVHVPEADIRGILEGFDFTLRPADGGLIATAPTYRKEVAHAADLIEEVARAIGMNTLTPSETLPVYLVQRPYDQGLLAATETVVSTLTSLGFSEAMNYSIVSREWNTFRSHFDLPDGVATVHLANPLSKERDAMRTTLLPGLLRNVAENLRFQDGVHLFEAGRAYFRTLKGPFEPNAVGIVATGKRRPPFWGQQDPGTSVGDELTLFDLKGVVAALLARLGVRGVEYGASGSTDLVPGKAIAMTLGGRIVGGIGEVGPEWLERFDIDRDRVLACELNLDALVAAGGATTRFERLPTQPAVFRDLSLVVSRDVAVASLLRTARAVAGPLLADLTLFDRYQGEGLPEGTHSLAVSLTFQDPDRTLQAEEVQERVDAVVAALAAEHGAMLRA